VLVSSIKDVTFIAKQASLHYRTVTYEDARPYLTTYANLVCSDNDHI